MAHSPMFGIETEYALTATQRNGQPVDRSATLDRLLKLTGKACCHLPDRGNGMFLANGGRLYGDRGSHPEYCTPECANPWDVVRHTLAGENILADIAALARTPTVHEVMLFKCNVDYHNREATWACHESYLHKADRSLLARRIIPHLVSRIIYTGAGGFNPMSAGLEFMLSPRVAHLEADVSPASTGHRGIVHTKDEPLSMRGYHRFHILCGESLCSHIASWLKVGATALVVAMIEAGVTVGDDVAPASPLDAMRTFAGDPLCRAVVRGKDGRGLTAGMIQRHYLTLAEDHLCEPYMPPWAPEVCKQWRAMLDRLRDGPGAVSTTLDWAIKLALFRSAVDRDPLITWESLPYWAGVTRLLESRSGTLTARKRIMAAVTAGGAASEATGGAVDEAKTYLSQRGISPSELEAFLDLKARLCEIDVRFGQLGGDGIFAAMDRSKVLSHSVDGIDRIARAMKHPPSDTRAHVRGACVRRLTGKTDRYVCDWSRIVDRQENRQLDLSDPFTTSEIWRDAPCTEGREDSICDLDTLRRIMDAVQSDRRGLGSAEMRRRLAPGQTVVIVAGSLQGLRSYRGRTATVTDVGQDATGHYYHLDIDEGRSSWRRRHLYPVSATSNTGADPS